MFDSQLKKMASENLVAADLLMQNIMILKPITDIIENYDLVAERNGKLYKIQVKSGIPKRDRIIADIRRSSSIKSSRYYDDDAYDVLALVDMNSKNIAYIPKSRLTAKASANIWLCDEHCVPTKGRWKNYQPLMFKDFSSFPFE